MWYNISMSNLNFTEEMEGYFIRRTWNHINEVRKYCYKIESSCLDLFKGLHENSQEHDLCKFEEPERIPYIFISWIYYCKNHKIEYNPSEEIKGLMNDATAHHIKTNKHHPEYWCPLTTNLVNPDARDEASQVIDTTKMPDIYIGEMVADWFATAMERGNSVKFWADKNTNKRWMFTNEQTKLIYKLVENNYLNSSTFFNSK